MESFFCIVHLDSVIPGVRISTRTEFFLGNGPMAQEFSLGMVHWDRSPPRVWSAGAEEFCLGMVHWDRSPPRVWSAGAEEFCLSMVHWDRSTPRVWPTGTGVLLEYGPLGQESS